MLCPPGRSAWIADARQAGRAVIVLTPLGSRLPRLLWSGYLERNEAMFIPPAPNERIPIDQFDECVGPEGIQPAARWSADCVDAAEMSSF